MISVPIFVISLSDAHSRRRTIGEHLSSLGLAFEFFDAVRGKALPEQERRALHPQGTLSPGEIGCYLSHTRMYEKMVREHIPLALILEDDAVLHSDVPRLLAGIEAVPDCDICFLGSEDWGDCGYVYRDAGRAIELKGGFTAYALSSGPFCLHAYLITLAGAQKRLSCALPIKVPIDQYQATNAQLRFFGLHPPLGFVSEESAIGSVSSTRWSGWLTQLRRHWWYYPLRDLIKLRPLRRAWFLRTAPFRDQGDWRTYESAFRIVPASRLGKRPHSSQAPGREIHGAQRVRSTPVPLQGSSAQG